MKGTDIRRSVKRSFRMSPATRFVLLLTLTVIVIFICYGGSYKLCNFIFEKKVYEYKIDELRKVHKNYRDAETHIIRSTEIKTGQKHKLREVKKD